MSRNNRDSDVYDISRLYLKNVIRFKCGNKFVSHVLDNNIFTRHIFGFKKYKFVV